MPPLPTIFVSHGSPMHALDGQGPATRRWRELGARWPRPRALLVASAHWETSTPTLGAAPRPQTIHDFAGFPPTLDELRYPAPGAPAVAARAAALLQAAGIAAALDTQRGLDHGAWVPLRAMYPAHDVPVATLSVQPAQDGAHHLRLGRALAALAADGVLVVGSGHATHNLSDWIEVARARGLQPGNAPALPYVTTFCEWLAERLAAGDDTALAHWHAAPAARRAHPTDEHLLPLLIAYGAAGPRPRVERLDAGVDAGVLALDAYVFTPTGH